MREPKTPIELYKDLLRQADELETISDPGYAGGGPTFWGNMVGDTRQAIADAKHNPIGTWKLSPEAIAAIHAVAEKQFPAIWREAAALLRQRAASRRSALEAQLREIQEELAKLEQPATAESESGG